MTTGEDIEIKLLLEAVYLRYHYDFRHYSFASMKRRLRAACTSLHFDSLAALQNALLESPQVYTRLLQFLTVQVSDMFRDPAYYLALRRDIVPLLATYPSLKIWIAGCSAGEEVYSFAILLAEEGLLDRTMIYATDINPEALRKAEAGVYALDRVPTFTENHRAAGGKGSLSTHYRAHYGGAMFDRALRKNVVFSDHSLATDAVFGEMHLVSCRNVLIYFDRALQDRAIGLMRDSLVRRGFLGVGTKETLRFSSHAADFTEFDPKVRWYQRC
ncbi:MAG: protein-glutamate O-methyltransferase CheR [Deltaproteobacteria bacterium]|nr:protein-glutamate O-methyltransferase CheR [Deltaproteobacteria bacterium]